MFSLVAATGLRTTVDFRSSVFEAIQICSVRQTVLEDRFPQGHWTKVKAEQFQISTNTCQ